MRVGIFTNKEKDRELKVTKSIVSLLGGLRAQIYLYSDLDGLVDGGKSFDLCSDVGLELMITVGGDGTILRIADYCARKDIPILGVNMGKLGFLAEVEKSDLHLIEDVVRLGSFEVEKRVMIEARVRGERYFALNEAVLCRESNGKMILLEVAINGVFVENFYCDGYIVSTPTGSTAYSLSAGGPILSPVSECLVLTPINSHSLYTRPIVISASETVSVKPLKTGCGACLLMDGVRAVGADEGETVVIGRSEKYATFVKINKMNFYSKLLKKLNGFSGV